MRFFYTIGVRFYAFFVRIASLWSPKAKLWIKGRKESFEKLSTVFSQNTKPVVWFHAASLGEFEQGRPVIEAYKKNHPEHKILLTFFSPSGYTIRQNYELADCVIYLPNDTPANARRFINIVKPQIAVFIKYEYWYNYLRELKKNHIRTYYISAIFRTSQYFFKAYGSWFRKQLGTVDHFFVQNKASQELLNQIGIQQVTLSGDTRFDRVIAIAANRQSISGIVDFKNDNKLLIAGSSWPKDEELLAETWPKLKSGYKCIIVPHLIDENHLKSIENLFEKSIRYSKIEVADIDSYDVLIMDQIGLLSQLYQYADIAYIGGGFGKGIHNTLEAAVFGIPVIFGPNYKKFQEACDLVNLKTAFVINNSQDIIEIIEQIDENPTNREIISKNINTYFNQQKGATETILKTLAS